MEKTSQEMDYKLALDLHRSELSSNKQPRFKINPQRFSFDAYQKGDRRSRGGSSRSTPSHDDSMSAPFLHPPNVGREPLHEIEDYIAYDHLSHHVLVKFKGTHPTLADKYEWQPALSLIYNFSKMKGTGIKDGLINELTQRVRYWFDQNLKNGYEIMIGDEPRLYENLLNLPLNPITDYGFDYDASTPFTGYIPAFNQFDDSSSEHAMVYNRSEMLVFCVRPRDNPSKLIFGLTDYLSLKGMLLSRMLNAANPQYYKNIYDKMENFVDSRRRQIQMKLIQMKRDQYRCQIPNEYAYKQKLFEELYSLMGGFIDPSFVSSSGVQSVNFFTHTSSRSRDSIHECKLTDILDNFPLDPNRLRAYIEGQWASSKAMSVQGGHLLMSNDPHDSI